MDIDTETGIERGTYRCRGVAIYRLDVEDGQPWLYPVNMGELKTKVFELIQTHPTPFTNGIPGQVW